MPHDPKNPFDQLVKLLDPAAEVLPTRPQRERRMRALGERIGLQYSHKDPKNLNGTMRFPFELTGGPSGVENALSGRWKDLPVHVFDRWQYEDKVDEETHKTRRVWTRHNCVLTRLRPPRHRGLLPRTGGPITGLADRIGMHDIEPELEDFNREYTLKCKDRKFGSRARSRPPGRTNPSSEARPDIRCRVGPTWTDRDRFTTWHRHATDRDGRSSSPC